MLGAGVVKNKYMTIIKKIIEIIVVLFLLPWVLLIGKIWGEKGVDRALTFIFRSHYEEWKIYQKMLP